jgi:ketosteroid isomerase-like protein
MSKEAIDQAHAAWIDAMRANDPDALGVLMASDVVLMPPHAQPTAGPRAGIDWFAGVVKHARTVAVHVKDREVIVSGDFGIERGSFVWTIQPVGGTPFDDHGQFIAIWQRQGDGAWRMKRSIWNSILPLPAMT